MLFDWDEEKARSNLAKHGVSFDETTRLISARPVTRKERKAYESDL